MTQFDHDKMDIQIVIKHGLQHTLKLIISPSFGHMGQKTVNVHTGTQKYDISLLSVNATNMFKMCTF